MGDLGVTHRVHLCLNGKRVVDILLAIIAILASSHGCGTISRNLSKSAFSEGVGHFECKFVVDGDVTCNPSMDRWIEELCSYNFAAGNFHTKKLCSRLFSTEVEIY